MIKNYNHITDTKIKRAFWQYLLQRTLLYECRGKDKKKKRVRYSQMFLLQLPALHKELNQNFRRSHPWPQEFTS